ncbi:hypothetical protein KIN20_014999 [Parelaphostrongylus tenuis]|uniref:Copper transport protein n=1 Tax=Parelaphostrongylus tenuis TaxID=148309 RepID=A0AAD5ME70_PARTN|nr:hypothetical protein KIN20_014999 [Parelaphostrongylus tenuis]
MPDHILADIDAFFKDMESESTRADRQSHQSHHNGHHDHSLHSQASHASHSGHEMKMWYHGGWNEVILFDFWRISSFSGLVLSFIAIFIMGAIYEGIKWFRVYLQMINSTNECVSKECGIRLRNMSHDKAMLENDVDRDRLNENVYNPTTTPPTVAARYHTRYSSPFSLAYACSSMRLLQAFLYIVQLILAYWLMLIVMTYNTWLTIAVIGGAGFGHWLFAVIKFRNPEGETADTFATDACH